MADDKPTDVLYVQNEEGGVHSVTREHYNRTLTTTTNAGNTYILPGWKEITKAAAEKENPQLFGAADPNVYLSDDELIKAAQRKKLLAELRAADPTE